MAVSDNELWVLSYYRASEISGSLFFGRLARSMKPGPIQRDMTRHFSDEALHAWYWSSCIERLGAQPLNIKDAYQDQYLAAAGMPANVMEVLAITQVFERRVIHQYARHGRVTGLDPVVRDTLQKIMADERWHIEWVGKALRALEKDYGKALIEQTLIRCRAADREIYRKTMLEHDERIRHLAPRARDLGGLAR
jgi:bacterioferritin (cytochrome b1)